MFILWNSFFFCFILCIEVTLFFSWIIQLISGRFVYISSPKCEVNENQRLFSSNVFFFFSVDSPQSLFLSNCWISWLHTVLKDTAYWILIVDFLLWEDHAWSIFSHLSFRVSDHTNYPYVQTLWTTLLKSGDINSADKV